MKTFFFVMLSIVFMLLTIKSAKGKVPQPQPEAAPKLPVNRTQKTQKKGRPSQPKMQNFTSNSPKKEEYFTYETLEPENLETVPTTTNTTDLSGENYQQIAENEQQKNLDLKFDEDEIKKGVVYSIILEKPDF